MRYNLASERAGMGLPSRVLFSLFTVAFLVLVLLAWRLPITPVAASADGSSQASAAQSSQVLEAGKPVERELRGGEKHTYTINVNAGEFLRVVVDQRGIDVVVTLIGPDGKVLYQADSPGGANGLEEILSITELAGEYLIAVAPADDPTPSGHYEISLMDHHLATVADHKRVAARKLFEEGDKLQGVGTAESLRTAIEKFSAALALWREAEDAGGQADALAARGKAYSALSQYRKALDDMIPALTFARTLNDQRRQASTLTSIGALHYFLGEAKEALVSYSEALPLYESIGNRQGEAVLLNNMASLSHNTLGDTQEALELYQRSIAIRREIHDSRGMGVTLTNIGAVYHSIGRNQEALETYAQALELRRQTGDLRGEGVTCNNMGLVYSTLGETQKALEYYSRADELFKKTGDRREEANTLHNIGAIYYSMGEKKKALEYYSTAMTLAQAAKDRRVEANSLNRIGTVYSDQGEIDKARDCYSKALSIYHSIGDRNGEAAALTKTAALLSELGNHNEVLSQYEQALLVFRAIGNRGGEARTLAATASVFALEGKNELALARLEEALPISRTVGDRHTEAAILYQLAEIRRRLGKLAEARDQIEKALDIIESVRARVSSQELRSSYLASVQKYYELYVDLLMRMHRQDPSEHFDAVALEVAERARARSLLELLVESRIDIREGVDPSLRDRERSLQQQLDAVSARQIQILGGKHTDEAAAAIAKQLNQLDEQYDEVRTRIRAASPRYAALTQPQPLSAAEIQRRVVDARTMLLEYSLGEERSFLWSVTPESVQSYELPKRAEIESKARQVYDLLTARNKHVEGETADDAQRRIEQAGKEFESAAATLSQMVLGPVEKELGSKRLLIVPDGALQFIPFAALPAPSPSQPDMATKNNRGTATRKEAAGVRSTDNRPLPIAYRPLLKQKPKRERGPGGGALPAAYRPLLKEQKPKRERGPGGGALPTAYRPLLLDHEITTIPSASALAILREQTAPRTVAPRTVAVLADPVFTGDDPRVKARSGTSARGEPQMSGSQPADKPQEQTPETRPLTRALEDLSGISAGEPIPRLPGTRWEASQIASLAPRSEVLQALDFAARRATATDPKLGQYRIIHFATHALLNNVHPELSGILLSMVNEHGDREEGFMRTGEIFNLKLPAELVVLSACRTALGKEVKGEGLIGLTRAFMYAGAKRVAVSLWSVEDQATAELMAKFYHRMLGREHLAPSAALRAAQLEMLKDPRWRSPYFWAPFIIQGELK